MEIHLNSYFPSIVYSHPKVILLTINLNIIQYNPFFYYYSSIMEFKKEFTLAQRKMESDRVLTKYPDRIPIICERSNKSKMEALDKKKYLVPVDLTTGQFVFIIRRRLQLPAEKAIFLFIGPVIPPSNATVQDVYHQYKDKDGFLYIQYSEENVFGGGSSNGPPNT